MPIEPNRTAVETVAASAIENEIPAYRAVLPGAVLALILGVLSVLAFASLYLLALAVLAILVGFLADRKIQKYSDLYTGRGLAQAGIGLGLIFGLTVVTVTLIQSFLYARQATSFGREFANILSTGTFEQAIWWTQPPGARINLTPEKLMTELTGSPTNAHMFEEKNAGLKNLKKNLATPGAKLIFEKLEDSGIDGLTPYGVALYEAHAPQAADPKEKEEFVRVFYKAAQNKQGRYEWWVDSLTYPAESGAFQLPSKPVDDGHGHAH